MLYGSYLLFTVMPVWAIAMMLYLVLAVPIQILRNRYEGLPYQVAWSADFGCAGLVVVTLIAATILQREVPLPLSLWMESGIFHAIAIIIALGVGVLWASFDWNTQIADRYHHIVVAPILAYLISTLLPVIFKYGSGVERGATICLLSLWVGLTALDIQQDRMNQRGWLRRHVGVVFKNET